jgi:hypothetical protein
MPVNLANMHAAVPFHLSQKKKMLQFYVSTLPTKPATISKAALVSSENVSNETDESMQQLHLEAVGLRMRNKCITSPQPGLLVHFTK